ncbi:MAG: metallophosphatase, partial [Acidobacteriota bacterium]
MSLAVLAGAQTRKLTILHTNDTHSAMVPFDASCAGIARMATLIKTLKATGGNVLTLNAGDVFVGSFEFNKSLGYPELKIMENLYDAMELGNHEFDLGVDTLAGVLSGRVEGASAVRLPILSANVDFAGTPLDGLVQACIIKKIGDVTVGIFGLVTQEPQHFPGDVVKRFRHPYEAADPEATLWHYAATLAGGLKAKCDVVVCLSHLGAALDDVLADNVPNIDVIVGGHSHSVFRKAV